MGYSPGMDIDHSTFQGLLNSYAVDTVYNPLHSYAVVCDSSQSDRSCMFFVV